MKALIRMELNKMLHSKWFVGAILVGAGIAVAHTVFDIYHYASRDLLALNPSEYRPLSACSVYANWLPASSTSTPFREIFFFVAPLLAVIPYAWSLRSELSDGYAMQVYTRAGRRDYFIAKSIAVFLGGGLSVAIPLLVSLVTLACYLPAHLPLADDFLNLGVYYDNMWAFLFYNYPLLQALCLIALDFALCGLWALVVLGISLAMENRVALMVAPYLFLLAIDFLNQRIFQGLGGLSGVQVSLVQELRLCPPSYPNDPLVIVCEMTLMLAACLLLCRARLGKDVL